jgi:hypothetical protein
MLNGGICVLSRVLAFESAYALMQHKPNKFGE